MRPPNEMPPEFLRSMFSPGFPLGELQVKTGCPLILLRNIRASQGLCNGTRLILRRASTRVLEVQAIGADRDGDVALLPCIVMRPSETDEDVAFVLKRRQFPVRLAFAMTINKVQGQSVKYVGVDLRASVFSHGQLCVALSRATTPSAVRVLLGDTEQQTARTPNVVYKQVFHAVERNSLPA
ncbi:unnamed protein product [Peniophora sp. CBMAI 1063]|nr:unnamed protein product [Peniophora sp. CBMAI 1063]